MNNLTSKNCKLKTIHGQLSVQILLYGALAIILLSGFLLWANTMINAAVRNENNEQAFEISEAGVEYYRWHLAHAPQDFQDGTGHPGPYIHSYYDKSGNLIGQFSLDITPPPQGSTLVIIKSTGTVTADPTVSKIIQVKMGIPSFAQYATVSNSDIRFGQGTEVFGPIYSNGGIRFDGLAHNIVSSALSAYNDPDHSGNQEFGVHTHVNIPPLTGENDTFRPLEAPPNPVMNRSDVFMAGRQFPVPAVDFTGITSNLNQMKSDAQSNGIYIGPSNAQGYHIIFKTDGTFDLYKVNSVLSSPNGCVSVLGEQNWGTWTIKSEQFVKNYNFPADNLIFVEDNLWVEGQINNARLTIGVARFPENSAKWPQIIINNNLLYSNFNGQDSLGLISQGDIDVGLQSADTLTIDGALVAQNGRVGRFYYRAGYNNQPRCNPYAIRSTINLYGMIMSNQRYGFAYTDGTGYQNRNITYDSNLLYNPPPDFPLTSTTYQIISWDELK